MKEYIVQVSDPAVWDTLHPEIINSGGGTYIPNRAVLCLNERPFNDYLAHYELSDAEAQTLEQDPRVLMVELQAELRPGVEKGFNVTRPTYTYDRSTTTTASMKNWGLWRATRNANPFGSSTALSGDFSYTLDGTGVDIVVVDTGVEPDHPEFAVNADGTGGSRVVDFDWYSLGVPGVAPAGDIGGYMGDSDGHGSNCASIAAGNTCGWASGAAIYSIRIFSGTRIHSPTTSLGVINSDVCYDLVKAFHLAKREAGNMRPTICTNSWGYRTSYTTINTVHFRGTTYYPNGAGFTQYGGCGLNNVLPYSGVTYLNQSANNCADAGVIMVGAAGNYWHRIDVPGGQDYDNWWSSTTNATSGTYYHRGSSPTCASSFINVGALDNSTVEKKAYFSETGPRVDIYSPGAMIMGAYANKPYQTNAVADPRDTSYYLNKISGTSQATPNVAGIIACVAQARPSMTGEEAKQFIIDYSEKDVLTTVGSDSYTNTSSLQDGNNRILQMPFTSGDRGKVVVG